MTRRIVLPKAQAWRYEREDFVRGMSGGFLFGIPLLYTMEAWWIGSYTDPPQMLAVLAVAYGVVFLLNRTDGFRQLRPDSFRQAAMDSVEAIAISVVCAFSVLVLLQQITPQTPLDEALGKTIIEATPFAIGVALARSILKEDEEEQAEAPGNAQPKDSSGDSGAGDQQNPAAGPLIGPPGPKREALRDIGATLVGAIIIASNIAPTDEVSMLEAAITPPWLLVMIVVSLVLSYCIVFVAGFTAQKRRRQQQGIFQHPLTETVITYLVSLLTALLMLWFFHRVGLGDPWSLWFKQMIILGLPATIGGAAGRLSI